MSQELAADQDGLAAVYPSPIRHNINLPPFVSYMLPACVECVKHHLALHVSPSFW